MNNFDPDRAEHILKEYAALAHMSLDEYMDYLDKNIAQRQIKKLVDSGKSPAAARHIVAEKIKAEKNHRQKKQANPFSIVSTLVVIACIIIVYLAFGLSGAQEVTAQQGEQIALMEQQISQYESLIADTNPAAGASPSGRSPAAPSASSRPVQAPASPAANSITVHVTNSGSKYHAAGCRYLSKSDIPISLDDAIASGYSACNVCGGGD
jgi:hypothetical protein